MAFHSLEEIQKSCREKNVLFWRAVLLEDMADRSVTEAESMQSMQQMWTAMKSASEQYDRTQVSASGLVGKMGAQMEEYRQSKEPLCGPFVSKVIARALEMGESNACMKRIVAAPTAGACGVLPAVLVPLYEEERVSEDEVIHALYTAAGIGQVIASRAFIAGAAGGCQAEIGAASAMAAGALVFLQGGDEEQISHGAAMALKNLLGLVCDGSRSCGSTLCKEKCDRSCQCFIICGYGTGGNYQQDSAGSGDRCDEGGRREYARLSA